MTKLPVVSGKGTTSVLIGLFGAASGALATALIDVSRGEPLALVVLALAGIILALLVAVANAFLSGRFVHIRELEKLIALWEERIAEYRQRTERAEELAALFNHVTEGALNLAKREAPKP